MSCQIFDILRTSLEVVNNCNKVSCALEPKTWVVSSLTLGVGDISRVRMYGFYSAYIWSCAQGLKIRQIQSVGYVGYSRQLDVRVKKGRFLRHVKPPRYG